jgi:hypothetical protein
MDALKNISQKPLESILSGMLFGALFALPWLNRFHLSTFLFLGMGGLLILGRKAFINYIPLFRQPVFIGFGLYYILQLIALFMYPHDAMNRASVDQKASLLVMPLLVYILLTHYPSIWRMAVAGFVSGCVLAALCCLGTAVFNYLHSGDAGVFFYHRYSAVMRASAIYFSLYIVIALAYLIKYHSGPESLLPQGWRWLSVSAGIFLFLNLLLLSSKMMIAAGSLLLLAFTYPMLKTLSRRLAVYTPLGIGCVALIFTHNPVRQRYTDITSSTKYREVFERNDFTAFPFDGLNLRLLLWRLGFEQTEGQGTLLFGSGGEHCHIALNERMRRYNLYTGDPARHSTGYLNYNMHNQYMESFVQFGLTGLLLLLFILAAVLYEAFYYRNRILKFTILIFMALFLTESAMETQAGILLFTLIISSEWIQSLQRRIYITSQKSL